MSKSNASSQPSVRPSPTAGLTASGAEATTSSSSKSQPTSAAEVAAVVVGPLACTGAATCVSCVAWRSFSTSSFARLKASCNSEALLVASMDCFEATSKFARASNASCLAPANCCSATCKASCKRANSSFAAADAACSAMSCCCASARAPAVSVPAACGPVLPTSPMSKSSTSQPPPPSPAPPALWPTRDFSPSRTAARSVRNCVASSSTEASRCCACSASRRAVSSCPRTANNCSCNCAISSAIVASFCSPSPCFSDKPCFTLRSSMAFPKSKSKSQRELLSFIVASFSAAALCFADCASFCDTSNWTWAACRASWS
mmetsp:Transcript_122806/g.347137  ORF Transcript_122806/g.347137 Transcript_122806/m.347137 type:complete len:318 (-) Transcript_122806:1444-2397(-)